MSRLKLVTLDPVPPVCHSTEMGEVGRLAAQEFPRMTSHLKGLVSEGKLSISEHLAVSFALPPRAVYYYRRCHRRHVQGQVWVNSISTRGLDNATEDG